jgi:hypothetical protein
MIRIEIIESEDNENIQQELQRTLQERNQFEIELYDFLLNPSIIFQQIPDDFWEPVTLKFENVHLLEDIIGENECAICLENHLNFKKTICCGQKMCNGCCFTWFETSVKCPYCYQDIREFDLKKPGF